MVLQVRNCSPETIEKLSENGSDEILGGLSCRGSEDSGNEDIENRLVERTGGCAKATKSFEKFNLQYVVSRL